MTPHFLQRVLTCCCCSRLSRSVVKSRLHGISPRKGSLQCHSSPCTLSTSAPTFSASSGISLSQTLACPLRPPHLVVGMCCKHPSGMTRASLWCRGQRGDPSSWNFYTQLRNVQVLYRLLQSLSLSRTCEGSALYSLRGSTWLLDLRAWRRFAHRGKRARTLAKLFHSDCSKQCLTHVFECHLRKFSEHCSLNGMPRKASSG